MADSRMVRAGILNSDAVNALSPGAEVFYRRLMSVADDHGRFDGRLPVLRAALFALKLATVPERDIAGWVCECLAVRLLTAYNVNERSYLQIEKFGQRIQGKSKWPDPPGSAGGTELHRGSPLSTVEHGEPPESTASRDARAVGVGVGVGDVGQKDAAKESLPSSSPAKPRRTELSDDDYLTELAVDPAYLGIDVRHEAAKMATWCRLNGKQPTRRRLISWLNRADRPLALGLTGTDSAARKRCL